LTFGGIPMLYIYLAVIVILVAVIVVTGYFYMKNVKPRESPP
jgi:hypothetical protein